MIRRQGYRFRLKPTKTDVGLLRRFVGCSRFVWNELLAQNEIRHERGEKRLGYKAMCEYLIYLKAEHPFLREAHSQQLQQTLKDLDGAYRRALDLTLSARFPRYKKKDRPQGIRFPQSFEIDGSGVYLPKIGWIGFRKSREIAGEPKNVTVSYDARGWHVAIQTERDIPEATHHLGSEVGIDLGVTRFAALSDGTFVEGPNALERFRERLALLQRRMARKVMFSSNWRKAKRRISLLQCTIANVRNDALHKASTTISKNHATVVMEDLRLGNMTASARGTKANLNRRILDQGWGEFRRQLGYKLRWCGGTLLLVDPRNTSRICACCGYASKRNRQTQAIFRCVACGHGANADTNAAINILRRAGQARIACGDAPVGGSVKQEARRIA